MMKHTLFLLIILFSVSGGCDSHKTDSARQPFAGRFNNPVFGNNVFLFDPGMDMSEIQVVLDTIFARQSARKSEFTKDR